MYVYAQNQMNFNICMYVYAQNQMNFKSCHVHVQ